MDSEVDHALGKGAVQFLGPKRFAANVSERPILYAVAIGPHSNDVDRILVPPVRSAQGRRHHMRLNQCQWRSSGAAAQGTGERSEEHTSELQSLMRLSYAVLCLKKKKITLTLMTYTLNN